ncbi:MAG: response regulator [Rhodocyclales bacterium]|nr:response regulator [Rhodocyclales bacterium]
MGFSLARSIRHKLMFIVLATTFTALLVSGIAMVVYDLGNFRENVVRDLITQAEVVGRASVAALAFDDKKIAQQNLDLLQVRPLIEAAALYRADGKRFASYLQGEATEASLPARPGAEGFTVGGGRVRLFHRIFENNEEVGTVFIEAQYRLYTRLFTYLQILLGVMCVALVVAAIVSTRLQAAIIGPILAVADVARHVVTQRDFSQRVVKTTQDEVGVLVDAFNEMLGEVGRRAQALESSNASLVHEMSERRAAEEALREADRNKDEFLATLAHELRNPLAPLQTSLEILRLSGDANKPALGIMARQLNQMVRLVDDLLDVSRITTGKLIVHTEVIALQTVMRTAMETVAPLVAARRHQLACNMPPEPVYLDADPVRLAQIFSNLLNNAIKFTPDNGRLAFVARLEGSEAVITIADNGIGISPDVLASIFGMFEQADHSIERSHGGLGVGLSLARRLVELHGGNLSASSEGDGRGSAFTVRLPLARPVALANSPLVRAAGKPGAPSYAEVIPAAGRLRILLTDDNRDFVTSMEQLLQLDGHEVAVAFDAAEALVKSDSFVPDFAFLDIGLPGMNGYSLAQQLRRRPQMKDCVIIAVTGWGQQSDRHHAAQAGFDYHLVKPVDYAQIQAMLIQGRERRGQL